jgi:hypothetical protein
MFLKLPVKTRTCARQSVPFFLGSKDTSSKTAKAERDKTYIQKLRRKYADNPQEGHSKAEIERIRDDDLLNFEQ